MRSRIDLTAAFAAAVAVVAAGSATGQIAPEEVRYDDYRLVRADLSSAFQLQFMESLGATALDCSIGVGPLRYVVPPEAIPVIEVAGIDYEVLHRNVQTLIDAQTHRLLQNQQQGGIAGLDACSLSWFDDYHSLSQINDRMDQLAADHADVVEKFQFGTTIEGRPMFAMRITAPGGDSRPGVLFNGCQHAREWVAPTVPMYIATQLACGWADGDPDIQEIMQSVEFIIVPMVNPDGYDHSWPPGDRFWRKNRRNNGDGTFGVDLNRNWEVGFGGGGSSGNTDSDTYRGTAPFSEPETSAMRDLYQANPHIVANVDFHSFSQLVLSPWGSFFELPPDIELYDELGFDMADAIQDVHGMFYEVGPAAPTLYQASGVSIDWTYGDQDVFSYTIELRDQGQNGFELPPEQILPTCEENFAAAMVMADWVTQGLSFAFPGGLPGIVESDVPALIDVRVTPITSGPIETVMLLTRVGAEPGFLGTPMNDLGDDVYQAALPAAACGATIEYYFEVESEAGVFYTSPAGAPDGVYEVAVTDIETTFEDDFETDQNWSVVNSPGLSDGAWDRGVPVGGGDRGDPADDADGSSQCYLTDNEDGNSDVDGGHTTLVSPLLDGSHPDAEVYYYRWYSNDNGGSPNQDAMLVEISGDGGQSWTLLETVDENANAWVLKTFRISDFVTPSAEVRIRFDASDLGDGSVVEAGVDGVRVVITGCDDGPGVPGDVDGDGLVTVADLVEIITNWGPCPGCPADLTGDGVVGVEDLIQVITNWS